MSNIYTWICLCQDNVEISISVKENLKKEDGNLINFGLVTIGDDEVIWDNLNFFISADYKEFKKECKKDLIEKGFKPKPIFRTIKKLIKRAYKLDLLT